MNNRRLKPWLFMAFCLVSFSSLATTLLPLSLDKLCGLAHVIVKAKILDIRTIEENKHFSTYITVMAEDVLKGPWQNGQTYVFNTPPKTLVSGLKNDSVLDYEINKTYLLFLPSTDKGAVMPIGGPQGQFEINEDQINDFKNKKNRLKKTKNRSAQSLQLQNETQSFLNSDSDHTYTTFSKIIRKHLNQKSVQE